MTYLDLEKTFKIDSKLINQFLDYLILANEKMNLTAIKGKDEMIEKHIYDSLLISKAYDFNNKVVLDVGSGAGFPGIPLAILYPSSHFVLLDATQKKIKYLEETITKLKLKNVEVKCGRVETLNEKEKYDVVIARALADLPIYLELSTYLAKIHGNIIALKGPNAYAELAKSKNAISLLNLTLIDTQNASLPNGDKRINLIFKKEKATSPRFPRSYALIKKRPL